jgi:hypothetical protein
MQKPPLWQAPKRRFFLTGGVVFIYFFFTALVTLPAFRQEVQTVTFFIVPLILARTV